MRYFYLLAAVIGTIVPMSSFLPWLMEHGIYFPLLLSSIVEDPISLFAWWDVLISALVLIAWIIVEMRRTHLSYYWLAILGTLCVGVSLGLPLFLYLRERARPLNP